MAGFAAQNARQLEAKPEARTDGNDRTEPFGLREGSFRTDLGAAGEARAEIAGAASFSNGKASETLTDAPIQASKNHPENDVKLDVPGQEKASRYGNDVGAFYSAHTMVGFRDNAKGRTGILDAFQNGLKDAVGEEKFSQMNKSDINEAFTKYASTDSGINGLVPSRQMSNFTENGFGSEMSDEEVSNMVGNLMAASPYRDMNPEQLAGVPKEKLESANDRFDLGVFQMKQAYYTQLKRMRDRYGRYASQMHPEDFLKKAGPQFFDDIAVAQDCVQLVGESGSKYFDFEKNEDDRDFRNLAAYFSNVATAISLYLQSVQFGDPSIAGDEAPKFYDSKLEQLVGGKGFTEKEQRRYNRNLKKRFEKEGKNDRLYGSFKGELPVLDKARTYLPVSRAGEGTDYDKDPSKYYYKNNKKLQNNRKMNAGFDNKMDKQLWSSIQPNITDKDKEEGHIGSYGSLRSASGKTKISGIEHARLAANFSEHGFGSEKSMEENAGTISKLLAGRKYSQMSAEEKAKIPQTDVDKLDATFDEGMYELKDMYYRQLVRMRDRYGLYGSQLHPEDFIEKAGAQFFDDIVIIQDTMQLIEDGGGKYFDFDNSPADRDFRNLADYFMEVSKVVIPYLTTMRAVFTSEEYDDKEGTREGYERLGALNTDLAAKEKLVGGAGLTPKEQKQYAKELKASFEQKGWSNRLFGKFKK